MQSTSIGLAMELKRVAEKKDDERIVVHALWDDQAEVWFAESDDVPGLALEAPSLNELAVALDDAIPALLTLNKVSRKPPGPSRPYRIIAELDRVPNTA